MNNEFLVTQLRDLGNAAQSLATAITMLYANLSINIPSVDEQQEQNTNHCGLDSVSNEEELQSLEELLGMEVVAICGSKTKCEGCARGNTGCVKVELVGGSYLCLDKPQQEKERPVISFDDKEGNKGLLDVMAEINEKADNFMDFLDRVVIEPQEQ